MSKEAPPRELFETGKQKVEVIAMDLEVSKNGNEMFKTQLRCLSNDAVDTFYFVAVEGKRWMLKGLLEAANAYEKDANNQYSFDTDDVIGKVVEAEIYLEDDEWFNQNGDKVKTKKNRIRRFVQTEKENPNKKRIENAYSNNVDDDPDIPF
jgi:hypothetical protein